MKKILLVSICTILFSCGDNNWHQLTSTPSPSKCNEIHLNEYTPAKDLSIGADSSLIVSLNFFTEENIRLENYILELEEDNQNAVSLIMSLEGEIQILSSCCDLYKWKK